MEPACLPSCWRFCVGGKIIDHEKAFQREKESEREREREGESEAKDVGKVGKLCA